MNYNNDNFTVTLMIGVAGSGKDTYITNDPILSKQIILCRDNIRNEIGIKGEKPFGNKEQENKVTEIFNERLIECCKNKQSCVINNTNLYRKRRKELINSIAEYKPKIQYIVILPPSLNTVIERRYGQIDANIICNMWKSIEYPTSDECENIQFHCNDEL
jgi:predicted kinase